MTRPGILVAGCGFVGLEVARLFYRGGWPVVGVTHSEESARALAHEPFAVTACDFTRREQLQAHPEWKGLAAIVHCASSGQGGAEAYRRVYFDGARLLLSELEPRRLLFTSSTSVYAQNDGGWVDETSPAEPLRETGRMLRETEDLVLAAQGTVLRLGGIYGPQRSVLLRKFLRSEARMEGGGLRYVNQIHRDDAARAIVRLVDANQSGVFNGVDNEPLSQRELYEWLAHHFKRPVPIEGDVDPNRKRGVTNKRVRNTKLRAIGWEPRYPSFREAVIADPTLAGSQ
ncbi:MAG: NAD-dependent epimerase/dehydratase family protein [Chthoniobacteraceae bacterium]